MTFFVSHFRMMMINQTTLESMRGASAVGSAYDVGVRANLEQVLGRNVALWFVPVATSLGDGITFPECINDATRLLDDDQQQ
jgi:hypothetical protein